MCSSLLGYQGLEEKPNSPLKVFKAAVFILAQLHYKAITQMAMLANMNKKHTGRRSQISLHRSVLIKPHLVAVRQTKCWHCWHSWVKSSAPGKLLGATEQLPSPRLCPCPSPDSKGLCQCRPNTTSPFPVQQKHTTAAQIPAGELQHRCICSELAAKGKTWPQEQISSTVMEVTTQPVLSHEPDFVSSQPGEGAQWTQAGTHSQG